MPQVLIAPLVVTHRWYRWYMDAMRGIYKTTKAADHDTQVFWLRVKKGVKKGVKKAKEKLS